MGLIEFGSAGKLPAIEAKNQHRQIKIQTANFTLDAKAKAK